MSSRKATASAATLSGLISHVAASRSGRVPYSLVPRLVPAAPEIAPHYRDDRQVDPTGLRRRAEAVFSEAAPRGFSLRRGKPQGELGPKDERLDREIQSPGVLELLESW